MSTPNKLTKARAGLILTHPFFASLLLPMPISENSGIPTMATDGESILFNPDWVESLSQSEVLFVLAHEMLHCVFDHMGRRGEKTPNRWNQAADYVINGILLNEIDSHGNKVFQSMPSGGLHNPSLVLKGNGTAEGVYALLPASDEKKECGSKGGALDQIHDAGTKNGTGKTDAGKLAQGSADLKVRVIAAKNAAKMQGRLSAGIERLVNEMVKPRVDWRDALRRFLNARAKVDYTYARPKRRFLGEDLYLPSLSGEKLGKIVIAVDCSGSVSPKLLAAFGAEINKIREDLKPSSTELIYFDSKVCGDIQTVAQEDDLSLEFRGGGGTAFSPVIKAVNAMEDAPTCVVFLTDLQCDDFGNAPDYPVLWCVMEGRQNKAPYGEILEVNNNE